MATFIKRATLIANGFRVRNASGLSRPKHIGTVARELAVATFDPSSNTAQRPTGTYGLGVYLPPKAIITRVWIDVVTTFTSAGSDAGTIAIQLQSANDVVAATAISAGGDIWDAGLHGTKIGTFALDGNSLTAVAMAAAAAGAMLKLTAEREITAVVASQALTAGKANIFVEYIISD
jgi:hypothetical protein